MMTSIDRALHWSVACLVIAQLGTGLAMDRIGPEVDEPLHAKLWYAHVVTGIMLAANLVPRIWWRLRRGWPEPLPQPRSLQLAAILMQRMLLAAVVLQAGMGIATLLTSGAANRTLENLHRINAEVILWLLAIHALGGLKHLLFDRAADGGRMFGCRPATHAPPKVLR